MSTQQNTLAQFQTTLTACFPDEKISPFPRSRPNLRQFPPEEKCEVEEPLAFFFSHRGPDTKHQIVGPVAFILKKLGVRLFFDGHHDGNGIRGGEDISSEIARGLRRCRIGVVFVSDGFLLSVWCGRELHTLLHREVNESVDIIFPVFVSPSLLNHAHYECVSNKAGLLFPRGMSYRAFILDKLLPTLLELEGVQGMDGVQYAKQQRDGWATLLDEYLEQPDIIIHPGMRAPTPCIELSLQHCELECIMNLQQLRWFNTLANERGIRTALRQMKTVGCSGIVRLAVYTARNLEKKQQTLRTINIIVINGFVQRPFQIVVNPSCKIPRRQDELINFLGDNGIRYGNDSSTMEKSLVAFFQHCANNKWVVIATGGKLLKISAGTVATLGIFALKVVDIFL